MLPALIRKVNEAKASGKKTIEVWGSGKPRREFLYSEDLAEACIHLLSLPDSVYDSLLNNGQAPLINIGTDEDLTIRELAELVATSLDLRLRTGLRPNQAGRNAAQIAGCKPDPRLRGGRRKPAWPKGFAGPVRVSAGKNGSEGNLDASGSVAHL